MDQITSFVKPENFEEQFLKETDGRPAKYARTKSKTDLDNLLGSELHFFVAQRVYCSLSAELMTDKGIQINSTYQESQYLFANESFEKFGLEKSGPIYFQGHKLVKEDSYGIKWLIQEHCHYQGEETSIDKLPDCQYVGKTSDAFKFKSEEEYINSEDFKLRIISRADVAPGIRKNEPGWGVGIRLHEFKSNLVLLPLYFVKNKNAQPTWLVGWNSSNVLSVKTGEWVEESFIDRGIKAIRGIKDFQ